MTVGVGVSSSSRVIDVGRVGRVGVDVVVVDGSSRRVSADGGSGSVALLNSSVVVDERTGRTVSRGSSGRVLVVGRRHGGNSCEVVLTSGALSAGAGEADGDGCP